MSRPKFPSLFCKNLHQLFACRRGRKCDLAYPLPTFAAVALFVQRSAFPRKDDPQRLPSLRQNPDHLT